MSAQLLNIVGPVTVPSLYSTWERLGLASQASTLLFVVLILIMNYILMGVCDLIHFQCVSTLSRSGVLYSTSKLLRRMAFWGNVVCWETERNLSMQCLTILSVLFIDFYFWIALYYLSAGKINWSVCMWFKQGGGLHFWFAQGCVEVGQIVTATF